MLARGRSCGRGSLDPFSAVRQPNRRCRGRASADEAEDARRWYSNMSRDYAAARRPVLITSPGRPDILSAAVTSRYHLLVSAFCVLQLCTL